MHFRRVAATLTAATLWTGASAILGLDLGGILPILDGGLNLDLLQPGALITLGLNADLLTGDSCSVGDKTILAVIDAAPIARVCACVAALDLTLPTTTQCQCTGPNQVAVCAQGVCACACSEGFFAAPGNVCVPDSSCPPGNVLTASPNNPGQFTCVCGAGFTSDGNNGCVPIGASARARMMHRRSRQAAQHVARAPVPAQAVFNPAKPQMERIRRPSTAATYTCPAGETACPLPSGGFECIDTTASLSSCGGCVGEGQAGVNCLAIPGALNVECHESKCQVGSCFKGWRFDGTKCI